MSITKIIIEILKILIVIEVGLIVLILIVSYLAKIYFYFSPSFLEAKKNIVRSYFGKVSLRGSSNRRKKHFLKKNITLSVAVFAEFEATPLLPNWQQGKKILIENVFKPQAKKLSYARSFSQRYYACVCLELCFPNFQNEILIKLINDSILLISVKAAKLAMKKANEELINAVIDVFSRGRRLQQTLFSDVLTKSNPIVSEFIIKRIEVEQNLYVKAFCYRLLSKIESSERYFSALKELQSSNIELKIAALQYCATKNLINAKQLRSYLQDSAWQVRLNAIKLLRLKMDMESVPLIGKLLRDPEWWVRKNAASALVMMGDEGIEELNAQDPNLDRFAYEVATHALITHGKMTKS